MALHVKEERRKMEDDSSRKCPVVSPSRDHLATGQYPRRSNCNRYNYDKSDDYDGDDGDGGNDVADDVSLMAETKVRC